ncbi:hypothetical protein TREES_T100011692 [Tupaia chinensis]|uniref:Uncharacterized protein n=1 Tax=Tupaia chinensis TaxID=246437 RepID=L9L5Q7_TUPCH|nr:hypothetical protein TREES_T100011692 [Tupaia chinensis]
MASDEYDTATRVGGGLAEAKSSDNRDEPPFAQRMGECADAECWSCALSGDPSDLCIAQQTVTVDTSNATSGGSRDQVKQKVRGLGTRQRMADNLRREQKPEWKESRQGVLKTF